METKIQTMKKYLLLFVVGTMLSASLSFAQISGRLPSLPPTPLPPSSPTANNPNESLPRFDLDFPGGSPKQLVQDIEKASGKPLNVVIPDTATALKLPAVAVKNVTVRQLFTAINLALGGDFFGTDGELNENSVWALNYSQPQPPPEICLFYQLSPFLDAGYKVEDITTAIETGWKMLGEMNPPKISYHKDTKLLIAVGEVGKLKLIDDVLKHLQAKPTLKDPAGIVNQLQQWELRYPDMKLKEAFNTLDAAQRAESESEVRTNKSNLNPGK
jgi:hypothetical protein